jgi:hypothetical protein
MFLFPPAAPGECRHRGLASVRIAVCGRAVLMLSEGQCPHPGASYWRRIGLEDAADNGAVGEHVVVIVIPRAGRARSRRALKDQLSHCTNDTLNRIL